MTPQVWTELKYGDKGVAITLAQLRDPEVLTLFRERAMEKALRDAQESEGVDEIVHIQDRSELTRLRELFNLIVPEGEPL